MKLTKKYLLILLAIILAGIFLLINHTRQTTATGYEDKNLTTYECSKPIKVKHINIPSIMGGTRESYAPIDPIEAAKFCHATGIE